MLDQGLDCGLVKIFESLCMFKFEIKHHELDFFVCSVAWRLHYHIFNFKKSFFQKLIKEPQVIVILGIFIFQILIRLFFCLKFLNLWPWLYNF